MTRIAMPSNVFNKLANIWKIKSLNSSTKQKLFNSHVIPVLTYACESWQSTKAIDKKLDHFENKCLRRLLNINWKEFVTNENVRERSNQEYVSTIIRSRRWKYLGHTLRSRKQNLTHQSLLWTPSGKR